MAMHSNQWTQRIFNIRKEEEFEALALELFDLQYQEVDIYRQYCDMLGRKPGEIRKVTDIPFLPISFFKHHSVVRKNKEVEKVFQSSGTTNTNERSIHHLTDLSIYDESLTRGFEYFMDSPGNYTMATLLPGYNENPDSSLIYMTEKLAQSSHSGKMLRFSDSSSLLKALNTAHAPKIEIILFGVTFALLDLSEQEGVELQNVTIIETGGMKGRRKEIVRAELHEILHEKLRPKRIISEYGMTELLSQAYCFDGEIFQSPPWMKCLIRQVEDPFEISDSGSGGINIIDLANINSCAFIETQDLGKVFEGSGFSVLGRFDFSDIRGCNLLYE